MTETKPKRRWFRFSLRTLLIVVTIVGVAAGWKMNQVRNLRCAVAEAQRLGAKITYAHELDTSPPVEPPGPKWLRQFVGDDFFEEVCQIQIFNDQANDDTLALIAKLPRISSLIVRSNAITDKGLASLAGASGLEALELSSANITASGYANLKGLRKLMTIVFSSNPTVDDSWLTEIAKLTQVHYLYLNCPQFTDGGLVHLQTASGLRELDVTDSSVTKEGVEALKTFLPNCKITGP
jgi:hypothetical protein